MQLANIQAEYSFDR